MSFKYCLAYALATNGLPEQQRMRRILEPYGAMDWDIPYLRLVLSKTRIRVGLILRDAIFYADGESTLGALEKAFQGYADDFYNLSSEELDEFMGMGPVYSAR